MTRLPRAFALLACLALSGSGCSASGTSDTGAAGSSAGSNPSGGGASGTVGVSGSSAGGLAGNAGSGEPVSASLSVGRLRAEYRVNPIGIDVDQPRFDWLLSSMTRGEKQTAYRVLVASSEAGLAAGTGDLWDTDRVDSAQSIQVVYQGEALKSRQRAWWKVRVWDKDGMPSAWSEPAFWERGLSSTDWKAAWLSASSDAPGLSGAQWLWFNEGDPLSSAPIGQRYFRKTFTLPADVRSARCVITADDEFELFVNGQSQGVQTSWEDIKVFDIGSLLKSGANALAVRASNTAAGPAGLIARLDLTLANGSKQTIVSDTSWKAANGPTSNWQMTVGDEATWTAAKSLAAFGGGPWGSPQAPGVPAYFRKEFSASKVTRARIYSTALGVYELWLNGKRVGKDYLAPGFTDYRKRLQVQTYDVTDLITDGDNALGAILADGWFNGKYFVFGRGDFYGSGPNRLLVQLELEHADGTRQIVATDAAGADAWKVGTGPIVAADNYDGESYDARAESPWSEAAFDDSSWATPVAYPETSKRLLVSDPSAQIQKTEEIAVVSMKQQAPGVLIYDLGQNMVGWTRLKVEGAAGARIKLRFGEVLNKDGTLYTTNLRSAHATDTYTLRGGGAESYEPHFTTHGFRYVELTGDLAKLSKQPDTGTLTGVVVMSMMTPTGTFSTSAPMVNQLQKNLVWGQRGNFLSVPTDCPQRDERQGWMGDAQVFVKTATFNMDVASFFTKWMRDVSDGQTSDGSFPEIAPNPDWSRSTPAWGDAGVIVPWTMYLAYGDQRILEEHYDSMKAWVDHVQKENPALLWVNATGSNYGDWLSINGDTDKGAMSTSFFAHSADLLARTAKVLKKTDDATKYQALFQAIRAAYQKAYVAADGKITSETQTAYSLALRFDLLTSAQRDQAAKYLAADVQTRGVLTTGFVGVAHLLPALSLSKRTDLAYQLLNNTKYPSWMYSINKGATTIWERWDGIMENGNFQTPSMNSFNHYSFGAVGEWMYSTIAGIDLDEAEPAYGHIVIRPQLGGGLSTAQGSLDTIRGKVSTSWKLQGDQFQLELTVPVGAHATVYLPYTVSPTEGGKAIQLLEGGGYEVESGSYSFAASRQ